MRSRCGALIDFEAEGLLDGARGRGAGGAARAARVAGRRRGPVEELRDAVAAGRLTLLPVERALAGGGPRYTPREVAEMAGVELDLLQRATAASAFPTPTPTIAR